MKMEGIELYPHNQKAYDNLCAMLRLGVPRRKKGGEHR